MREFKGYHLFEGEELEYFMNHHYRKLPWYKRVLIKTKSAILYVSDDGTKISYILDKHKPITWALAFFASFIVIGGYIYIGIKKLFNH